jgi:hypothetical protein
VSEQRQHAAYTLVERRHQAWSARRARRVKCGRLLSVGCAHAELGGADFEPHQLAEQRREPRIVARGAQRHVGRAARLTEHVDVRERRLEGLGHQAAQQRDVVGHVVGDDDHLRP